MCEQEHLSLSNAFLHTTLPRAPSIRIRARQTLFVGPSLRCDWSIHNGAELNGSVYSTKSNPWTDDGHKISSWLNKGSWFDPSCSSLQILNLQFRMLNMLTSNLHDLNKAFRTCCFLTLLLGGRQKKCCHSSLNIRIINEFLLLKQAQLLKDVVFNCSKEL